MAEDIPEGKPLGQLTSPLTACDRGKVFPVLN